MLKNCFSLPKLLYFLRTSTCSNHPALLDKYLKIMRDRLSKVCNVNVEDISSTQLALPAEMGGLGVSSASLLALPAFVASAFGACDFLTTIFSEPFEDVSWLSLTNEQKRLRNGWVWRINRKVLSMEPRKIVQKTQKHGPSCTKSAGRFSRHAALNSLPKQTLGSLDLPSML